MNTTFTINVSGFDSIDGFNSRGERFAAVRHAGGGYFCGLPHRCNEREALANLPDRDQAMAWIVAKLMRA